MNIGLIKEVYGNAWFIDPISMIQLSKTLEYHQNGGAFDDTEEKANSFGFIPESKVLNAGKVLRMQRNSEDIPENSIAQYNFDSVITKGGGMSHHGTVDIANQFRAMEANENIIGHIFKVESGGGSSNAIKYLREVSSKENRKKPLVTYFEDINASAAYYISSDSDFIFSKSKDALVGSIGTMIQLEGYKAGTEDKTGKRHIRIYASQSVNKNKEFENAINEFSYDLIKSKLLDPHAAEFIKDIEANRPNVTAIQKTGEIFRAEEVVGTLIDGIGSFEDAVNKVYELSDLLKSGSVEKSEIKAEINSTNNNKSKMDLGKLKAEHPALYAEVIGIGEEKGIKNGTKAEKGRAEAWAVYMEIDPEKVKAGIESGEPLSQKAMAEFNLQATKKTAIAEIKGENAGETNTGGTQTPEEIKAAADKAEMAKLFNDEEAK